MVDGICDGNFQLAFATTIIIVRVERERTGQSTHAARGVAPLNDYRHNL